MDRQNETGWAPLHDRTRQWYCHNMGFGDHLLRFYVVLAEGEQLAADYPPTVLLNDQEWADLHAANFGLDLDGHTVVDQSLARRDIRDWPS